MKPLVAALAYTATLIGTSHAAVVFSDDFSEPDGTAIIGKAPDVGSAWTGTAPNITGGAFDTTGAARAAFGSFSASLGAGDVLTLSYDTLALGNFFSGGYAGVSLYSGGNELVFTGDAGGSPGNTFWAVDGAATGLNLSSDSTAATSVLFSYVYDTGAWTFSTTSGVNLSGTATANLAFDQLRVANGSGGDISVDNLVVNIDPVPEPAASVLLGLGVVGLAFTRRRPGASR